MNQKSSSIKPLLRKQAFSLWVLIPLAIIAIGIGYYVVTGGRAAAACTTTLSPSDAAESSGATDTNGTTTFDTTVDKASGGDVICLNSGNYPNFFIRSSQNRTGYVTIQPAPGAAPVLANQGRISNSSWLRFQNLKITAEFDIADVSSTTSTASHDIQFINNDISGTSGPRFVESGNFPIINITVQGNYIHDIDAPGACAAGGSAGTSGQGVTLEGVDNVLVKDNTFKSVGWHFIQGGADGTGGVTVDHNLFTGPQPADDQACAHMNVWQIFGGGSNDTFSNNVVVGSATTQTTPVASNSLMFENGPGGSDCTTTMNNTNINNNLFVDENGAYEFELMATTNLSVTNNTVVGSAYGALVARNDLCGASTNVTETHNIVTNNSNGSANFDFGACVTSPTAATSAFPAQCLTDNNVSQDASAGPNSLKGAFPATTHYVTGWTPAWQGAAWSLPTFAPGGGYNPPSGYYQPAASSIPFQVGYQGTIGPEASTLGTGGGTPPPSDTTPPTASISAPAGGTTVSGSSVAISASASDNVAVASVQFKLDGANLGSADTASPYTTTWDTTGASNGTHTLTAVATDTNGNTATSAPVTVTVGNATVSTSGARGRPTIVKNTLVSDQGTLLRGGTLWLVPEDSSQYNWAISTPTNPDTDGCTTKPCPNPWPIFNQYHLNTVRLATEYGPGNGSSLSQTEAELDSAINQATANHMYAIVDLHWSSGEYDLPSAKAFWTAIAARYKNNSNVIFELLNEPVAWRPNNYTSQNIQDEETLYNIVHTAAPQTPVIMMSFAIPMNTGSGNTSPTMTDVSKQLTGVDWSNTAVGFHGYWVNTDAGEAQLKQNFPTIDTEFGLPCNQSGDANAGVTQDYCVNDDTNPSQVDTYQSQVMEELGISWICWDCNSQPGNSSRLAAMQTQATAKGWWWPADTTTTGPTVNLTAPANNATVSGSTTVTASASNSTSVQFQVDGVNLGSADTSSPYSVSWNTATSTDGIHNLTAIATDAAGDTVTSSVKVNVNNTPPPPTTPANLHSTASTQTSISLAWNASTDTGGPGLAGYHIYRSDKGSQPYATVPASATSYIDSGLTASTGYSYTIDAYDTSATGNPSPQSSPLVVSTAAAQQTVAPPSSLKLASAATYNAVSLAWTASTSTNATHYYVVRSSANTPATTIATLSNVTSYNDTSVAANTAYSYYILAGDGSGNYSSPSGTINVTTPNQPVVTPPPTTPVLTAVAASSTQVNLSWTASTYTGGNIGGYYVYRSDKGSQPYATVTSGTTWGESNLTPSTSYTYTVKAFVTASIVSAQSGPATVTTPASTVTSAFLGTKTVGSQTDRNSSGMAEIFQTTATTSGTVSKIQVYLNSSSKSSKIMVGIYQGASGKPGQLLTQGATTSIKRGAWNTVPVPQVAVTAKQTYWIAILGSGGGNISFRDTAHGSSDTVSASSSLTSLPSQWVSGASYHNSPLSAYATN